MAAAPDDSLTNTLGIKDVPVPLRASVERTLETLSDSPDCLAALANAPQSVQGTVAASSPPAIS